MNENPLPAIKLTGIPRSIINHMPLAKVFLTIIRQSHPSNYVPTPAFKVTYQKMFSKEIESDAYLSSMHNEQVMLVLC